MAHFVLVHGSFHGGWCWSRLTPILEAAGHRVSAPNLPASGGDPAPVAQAGLESYAARIEEHVEAADERVILVGHSMGGIVASAVAERLPEKLGALVYVSGLMLRSGESLAGFLETIAHLNVEDLVLKTMQVSADGTIAVFPREKAAEVLYNACSPADAEWAAGQLTPQATKIYGETQGLGAERYGRVRRFYVRALRDRAVDPAYQDTMLANSPCESVFTLDSDHSSFLSCPDRLADILLGIADLTGRSDAAGASAMLPRAPRPAASEGIPS